MPTLIYMNNARLSAAGIILSLHMVIFIAVSFIMKRSFMIKRDIVAGPEVRASYLPVMHLGCLLIVTFLICYNGYLHYGSA